MKFFGDTANPEKLKELERRRTRDIVTRPAASLLSGVIGESMISSFFESVFAVKSLHHQGESQCLTSGCSERARK
jgi:hypothetical protein